MVNSIEFGYYCGNISLIEVFYFGIVEWEEVKEFFVVGGYDEVKLVN